MIVKNYTYESILAELPKSIKETYSFVHNDDINALMVSYDAISIHDSISIRITNTLPIDDIYEIFQTDTSVSIRGNKCIMTIFKNVKILFFQVF